ncbi:MAG: hypothetical protein AAB229_00495 [Candidatus Hydrogenedentota bacterium]
MNLAIDETEKELLETLLHRHIGETRVGIRHARSNDYKDILRKEETISSELMDKLQKLVTTQ